MVIFWLLCTKPLCQAPRAQRWMRFRGLPRGGLDTSGLKRPVGQGPAYRRAPERVTKVAQSQEGTEEVTPWTSKEDSGCKGRDCDVRQCWGADLAARSRKHCILEPRVWRQTGRTQVSVLHLLPGSFFLSLGLRFICKMGIIIIVPTSLCEDSTNTH